MAVAAEELPSLEMERVREHKCPWDAGKQQGTEPPPTTSREDAAMPKHQFQPIETMLDSTPPELSWSKPVLF